MSGWAQREAERKEDEAREVDEMREQFAAVAAERDALRAEVDMLRGVGCDEVDGGEERGPCGACLKCARRERDALRCMLTHAVITHPLPWRIEQDWTWEVIAANGATVAKCQTPAEAQAIVSLAETFRASLAAKEPAR